VRLALDHEDRFLRTPGYSRDGDPILGLPTY
jgi:hypothetical protein